VGPLSCARDSEDVRWFESLSLTEGMQRDEYVQNCQMFQTVLNYSEPPPPPPPRCDPVFPAGLLLLQGSLHTRQQKRVLKPEDKSE